MQLKQNESGMVSIIVSTIIMTVLTLIVLSFASIMQREQRQALDRELSTQAFYAAESAVNDVRNQVYTSLQNGTPLTDSDTCGGLDSTSDPIIDADLGTEIGCVTVSTTPQQITFDSIGTDRSQVFTIDAVDAAGNPTNLTDISFYYDDPDGATNFKNNTGDGFSDKANWGDGPGILRAELVPIPNGGPITRDALRAENRVYYGYPSDDSNGDVNWITREVDVVESGCGSNPGWPRTCRINIEGLPAGFSRFAVKLTSIYEPVSVTVVANDVINNPVLFRNSQVVVDSTGRANDVISRVREVLPLTFEYDYAESGLDVGSDVCKLIEAETSLTTVANLGTGISGCDL